MCQTNKDVTIKLYYIAITLGMMSLASYHGVVLQCCQTSTEICSVVQSLLSIRIHICLLDESIASTHVLGVSEFTTSIKVPMDSGSPDFFLEGSFVWTEGVKEFLFLSQ